MVRRLSQIYAPDVFASVAPPWATQAVIGSAAAIVAFLIRALLETVFPGVAPFALLFPATVVATLLAGWQAAAWSIVVGGLFTWRFILSPDGGFSQTGAAEAASLTLFLVASAMIAAFSEAYRRSTRALEIERAHQALLINELNHRVKNTLATVQSIARQTVGRSALDTAVKDAFEARLLALSRAHNVLTAQSWESVDLKDIVAEAMSPFEIGGRVTATGPSVRLAPRQALTLAMALHELATNAAKHGALAGARGQVAIGWTVEHGVLDLAWTETGGPPVTAPTRRGFGSRLLEQGLPRELKAQAQLSFPGAGAAYRLKVPLADPTGAASVFSPLAAAHERA